MTRLCASRRPATCCPPLCRSSPAPPRPPSLAGCTTPTRSSMTGWSPYGVASTSPSQLTQPGVAIPYGLQVHGIHCRPDRELLSEGSRVALAASGRRPGRRPTSGSCNISSPSRTWTTCGTTTATTTVSCSARLNEHYRPALRLARLVLANLTLQDVLGETQASSFMLDMNELFERFVTERLAAGAPGPPRRQGPAPATGSTKKRYGHHQGPTCCSVPTGTPRFVADIKYKLTDEDGQPAATPTTTSCWPTPPRLTCPKASSSTASTPTEPTTPTATEFRPPPPGPRVPCPPEGTPDDSLPGLRSIRIRNVGKVLHAYALDMSGTAEDVARNLDRLADWIEDRAAAALGVGGPTRGN